MLNSEKKISKYHVDLYNGDHSKTEEEKIMDEEADYFAYCLLMPQDRILYWINVFIEAGIRLTLYDFSKQFGVSIPMVTERLKQIEELEEISLLDKFYL